MSKGNKGTKDDKANMKPKQSKPKPAEDHGIAVINQQGHFAR